MQNGLLSKVGVKCDVCKGCDLCVPFPFFLRAQRELREESGDVVLGGDTSRTTAILGVPYFLFIGL